MKKTTTLPQIRRFIELFEQTPAEQTQAVIESGLLTDLRDANLLKLNREDIDSIRKILAGTLSEEKAFQKLTNYITHTFRVLVDETIPVEEAVKTGKFGWSNENITSENFPQPKNGQKTEKEVFVFHFGKRMSSETVIAEMQKAGYRPATIWDLIGLAIEEPNLQRSFPIVALSSVCALGCRRDVPYLYVAGLGRGLSLRYFGNDWDDGYRFLAVRN